MLSFLPPSLSLLLQEGAQEAGQSGAEETAQGPSFLWPMLGIAAIFYFVMIAPERKRRKEREAMVEALGKGDKVMTTSGIYGTITQVQGEVVTVQIADGVRVKFALAAIQGKVDEKGDGKKDAKDGAAKKGGGKPEAAEVEPETVGNSK